MILNPLHLDTTPGLDQPFSPPPGWRGDGGAYRALLRQRFRDDPWLRQWFGVIAFRLGRGDVLRARGPYAREAEAACAAYAARRRPREARHG